MKVADLQCAELDYWVAKAEGFMHPRIEGGVCIVDEPDGHPMSPSTDWAHGGPIIARERINLLEVAVWPAPGLPPDHWRWTASLEADTSYYGFSGKKHEGPTPLIAAMRAYVASKFGEEVS